MGSKFNMLATLVLNTLLFSFAFGGITIPKDDCRWMVAEDWETDLKCDGNEVAVGGCSSGFQKDCPGGTVHQLKCCAMDTFYYTDCDSFSSNYGVPIDCRDHGDGLILEGQCHSGFGADCHGDFNQVSCCGGHYDVKIVGSTTECTWMYGGFGDLIECGRSDEILWKMRKWRRSGLSWINCTGKPLLCFGI